MGKSERKSPLGRSVNKREHNSTMDLKQIIWMVVDRIDLAENMNKYNFGSHKMRRIA